MATVTHGASEGKRLIDDLIKARVQSKLDAAETDPQVMWDLLSAYSKSSTKRGNAVRNGLALAPALQGVRE
ncbi:hypothetical protein [Thiothrix fructosivorans]|uniref:Uncharacterized protein n=1 Tax=Thiothrix fructosivorans TaxID=111770 RepID=A0A8B0SJK1_9GAMM|nr:hypothetical protein [Thiothrix fructosivorans]MBO0611700.1 hypothetical protein [Thiothrix fructosivorans]QTX10640.1 hypothetical protein J1836_019080 [Thiothrix fructosivorans]